ncbi:hypothetical protein [Labedaea rhizosphaerae]|uniref:hypothetical protein n=1 Tax=Labedaea rhizosphaerae TaxID=598644 RepID=UPI00105CA10B|nr:hypothetical protein [Labedaea rhizosphaerae]
MNDDEAAYEAVGHEINRPDPARWRAMTLDDDRVQQTYRVLGQLVKNTQVALTAHKSALSGYQGTRAGYRAANAEYQDWKSRTVHFLGCLNARRRELEDRVRWLRQGHALDRVSGDLRALAKAVADHRDAIRSECGRQATTADRLLWARLDVLSSVSSRTIEPDWTTV